MTWQRQKHAHDIQPHRNHSLLPSFNAVGVNSSNLLQSSSGIMGNANSTLSGEIEDRDPTSSPSLSRHSSRTGPRPSHNHAYGQGAPPSSYTYLAASGAVAGGSTTPVSLSRKSSIDSESHQAAGLHRPSTSHSPPRSRSRSSSLQGFWTRNKANTTQQQLDHAHGEPNVSSLLRREPVNAPAEFSGAGTSPSTGTGEESAAR